ncbi:helix-turn-helix domain-containing protein [Limosilactobacillus vaginalis]|uniref:Helix-turn-helix domain-containing protein n=1 Tax=Limosilactobacillus vaginalis TaxID=1633 RepID=A0ABT4K703_9LACO|nr:helix-turn-helix domain-containing protein [Limosilactobacillus vaginalis]MCZ3746553.1 helix-turn-helix domain-containing protein [Limosilactobacillus vaginalis]MCZ3751555.1 helix-turn-helix domain-containing protein [Limosilactobacillus vaginalis]MCZ3753241.1 helix-turn-helix domain-containing protein [Limosilactobacillus vaginalis]MCZ3755073.1 helix-turn-helix domain-containing protein [Limosilactobacillus vaginalis]MCZ3756727.1 helix-turn-helix domain-containing protein [Limosilactobacil
MTKRNEKSIRGPFDRLTKEQQTLIRIDFEGNQSNATIAPKLGLKSSDTVSRWRAKKWYELGLADYTQRAIKTTLKRKALNAIQELLNAKSEMVRLQAANTLLKMAGMLSDNDTPELMQAKIRKANADARVAEARAKSMEDNGQDVEMLLDKLMDKVTEEDKKNGPRQSSDS